VRVCCGWGRLGGMVGRRQKKDNRGKDDMSCYKKWDKKYTNEKVKCIPIRLKT